MKQGASLLQQPCCPAPQGHLLQEALSSAFRLHMGLDEDATYPYPLPREGSEPTVPSFTQSIYFLSWAGQALRHLGRTNSLAFPAKAWHDSRCVH